MAATERGSLLSWKRLSFLLGALLITTILLNSVPKSVFRFHDNTPEIHHAPQFVPTIFDNGERILNYGNVSAYNDNMDGLTDTECRASFPDLYDEIVKTTEHWMHDMDHTIVSEDLDTKEHEAMVRILIHQNQLRILASSKAVERPYASPDRALGLLNLIHRALASATAGGDMLPTIEVTLKLRDFPEIPEQATDTHAAWSFAKTIGEESHRRLWLMPNFDFWYYEPTGSFEDSKRYAMQLDASFETKIPQLVWRGNAGFNEDIRGALIKVTKGKSWADIKEVHGNEDPPVSMAVDQFCRYAMTVYTEGVTYSGRLKFLMNCGSLLISHEPKYVTHYSHLLVSHGAEQNFVLVKRDWSDLEEKVQYYLQHPEEADKIIQNMLRTFRSTYTTRAAVSCYIRRLVRSYSHVTTEWEYEVQTKAGVRLRGVSFEEFMDRPQDKDYRLLG